MRTTFEELIRLEDGDGASVAGRIPGDQHDLDVREVLGAWSIERHRAVEAELVLKKAHDFLKRRVRPNRLLSDSERRESQALIRLIQFLLDQQG